MSNHKVATVAAGVVLMAVAAAALYRLLVGFPITIGGAVVGQTSSLFVFVICAALSLMLFLGSGRASE